MDRPPAELIRERVRFTLQPGDAPPDAASMERILDQVGTEDMLLFSTDWPHLLVLHLGKVAEMGPAADLFANPLHPYTRYLISAVPVPDVAAEHARLHLMLPGEAASATDPPSGCRFRTRCRWRRRCAPRWSRFRWSTARTTWSPATSRQRTSERQAWGKAGTSPANRNTGPVPARSCRLPAAPGAADGPKAGLPNLG